MAPSLFLPLSTLCHLFLFPLNPFMQDEMNCFLLFSHSFSLRVFIHSFSSSCGGKHVYLSLPGSQRTATCISRRRLYFFLFPPTQKFKESCGVCVCSPGSEEGPVSVLAQRASHRERSWQGLSCTALLDFRAALCIHV